MSDDVPYRRFDAADCLAAHTVYADDECWMLMILILIQISTEMGLVNNILKFHLCDKRNDVIKNVKQNFIIHFNPMEHKHTTYLII